MQTESLNQYIALRDSIFAEREQVVSRLREIDAALGSTGLFGRPGIAGLTPTGRVRNEISLLDAVRKALDGKNLTKHEILDDVLRMGYQFSTSDPLNSLGVVLYGKKPKFKRIGSKFGL